MHCMISEWCTWLLTGLGHYAIFSAEFKQVMVMPKSPMELCTPMTDIG